MFIVVEGNIGAGKTSLVKKLCDEFNAIPLLEEFAENTFLPRFYEDPEKFAFPLELSFLAARYKQMTDLFNSNPGRMIIADYHFEKCRLFASVNLPGPEFELFDSFFQIMTNKIPEPQHVVYLKTNIDRLRKNINKRGRSYEHTITDDYLTKIQQSYESNLLLSNNYDKVIIDTTEIDFVENQKDYQELLSQVKSTISL